MLTVVERILSLQNRSKPVAERAQQLTGARIQAQGVVASTTKRLTGIKSTALHLSEVMEVIQALSSQARGFVGDIVTPLARTALSEIFGPDARFEVLFRELPKSGWTAEILSGSRDQIANPLTTDGQSMAEIVSDGILRPLVLALHRPALNRVLVLDEPFAGLDRDKPESLCKFLRSLADQLGLQVIITSHTLHEEYDGLFDNVIRLGDD